MTAYYNEFDAQKAAWLRELIKRDLIAQGDVDERSIRDIQPDDLRGYTQCHFFAGIGVWSYALRLAGWPDDKEVWTGSCPCQNFSVAGKRRGFADERHLWPDWFRLIAERNPGVVFGEQSASKDALAWLDLVQSDMEGKGYSLGALDICAAGFGAPHIRQRLYFVADSAIERRQRGGASEESVEPGAIKRSERLCVVGELEHSTRDGRQQWRPEPGEWSFESRREPSELGNSCGARPPLRECEAVQQEGRRIEGRATEQPGGSFSRLADADGGFSCDGELQRSGQYGQQSKDSGVSRLADTHDSERRAEMAGGDDADWGSAGRDEGYGQSGECRETRRPGPTNGFWGVVDWLFCTDGKWRPVEAGTFPLDHGAPARVGRLRGYGDAIVATQAEAFIRAYMEERRIAEVDAL